MIKGTKISKKVKIRIHVLLSSLGVMLKIMKPAKNSISETFILLWYVLNGDQPVGNRSILGDKQENAIRPASLN